VIEIQHKRSKKMQETIKPTNKMVLDYLKDKIKELEYRLGASETKVVLQEDEIVKLKQENANLKWELKEVA
tara:strand:+ start:331 stop:543 length:213 start_codon:yes stop_codon:yes gene_type:complete